MDFYTDGMPKFYGPFAAIIGLVSYFFFVLYINRLCDEAFWIMDLDLLGKLNVSAFIAAGGALLVLGYVGLYLQTGTFTKCLTQIEPVIWRDLFKKTTVWTAFRVFRRKRHYPRKRAQRVRNDKAVREAVIQEDKKEEEPDVPATDAFDLLISLQPEPVPKHEPLDLEWEEPTE